MINTKSSVTLHNKFNLELIDSRTGRVKQTAQAENTVLDQFYSILGTRIIIPAVLYMGSGTGTPSAADTSLFTDTFYRDTFDSHGDSSVALLERTIDLPTSTLRYSVTFPATSNYVGKLTEIGVGAYAFYNTRKLITHAMLSDSEGNPISIDKTELDILIVTVTLYLTITNKDTRFKMLLPNKFTMAFNILPSDSDVSLWGDLRLYRYATEYFASGVQKISVSNSSKYDRDTRTYTAIGERLRTSDGNNNGSTYYNGVGLDGHGYIRFPDASVFPPYTVHNVPVGTGDGATQDFECPFALFVKDSDVVYKNGVALTRGTDYTISNVNYHALNPCVTPGNFAAVSVTNRVTEPGYKGIVPFTTKGDTYKPATPSEPTVVLLDMREPDPTIGRAVDGLSVQLTAVHTNWGSSQPPIVYGCTVEYSDDNETWHEVPVELVSEYVGCTNYYYYTYRLTGSFSEIDAPYVRVTFSVESIPSGFSEYYTLPEGALYKLGSPIHFNVAPAEGDVITMDVQLDRPYKSTNYVLDASMSITLE